MMQQMSRQKKRVSKLTTRFVILSKKQESGAPPKVAPLPDLLVRHFEKQETFVCFSTHPLEIDP